MESLHPLAALSIDATKYGQALGPLEIPVMAARLYHYHTLPASASLVASLTALEQSAASGALGPGVIAGSESPNGLVATAVDQDWTHWSPASTTRPGSAGETSGGTRVEAYATVVQFKLYVSPAVESLRDTLLILGEVLPRIEALGFKRARGVSLLRPDKAVLYFDSWESLQAAGRILRDALRGVVPHGVPFTAPLFDDTLISWGVDPPAESSAHPQVRVSWREWITTRVAEALVMAMKVGDSQLEPWEAAMTRLALDGVDLPAFSPGESLTGLKSWKPGP